LCEPIKSDAVIGALFSSDKKFLVKTDTHTRVVP